MKPKVFCIGLSKTGTSSLAKAMEYMGYHTARRQKVFKQHFPNLNLIEAIQSEDYQTIFRIIPKFDAFVDNPWPLLYQKLADQYPEARFILTTREEEEWLQSAANYFGSSGSAFRKLLYGKSKFIGNESVFLKRYKAHNIGVKEFFKDQPDRLLVLPLESPEKWELLAEFLNRDVPKLEYPRVNETLNSKSKLSWLKVFNLTYLEVFFTLCYARFSILNFPFKKLAKRMSEGKKQKDTKRSKGEVLAKAIQLSQITKSISKKVPFRSLCFEQALAMQMLLKRRGIASEIIFGLNSKNDQLAAHAWCICQGVTLSGEKGKEQFAVLKSFGKQST